jgi:hypothetical protein
MPIVFMPATTETFRILHERRPRHVLMLEPFFGPHQASFGPIAGSRPVRACKDRARRSFLLVCTGKSRAA